MESNYPSLSQLKRLLNLAIVEVRAWMSNDFTVFLMFYVAVITYQYIKSCAG